MTTKSSHIFHIVDQSPWPISRAMGIITLTLGAVQFLHTNNETLAITGTTLIIISSFLWWRDISREATFQGLHTSKVILGLRFGIILFILSETMFFFSFFWAFFHRSLSPVIELGLSWPPTGIFTFNPIQIPLLNTIILLSSGVRVTWTHHALMAKNSSEVSQALIITILLGLYFTALQAIEYWEAYFRISDSIYGTTFFLTTGFHGLHVIFGTTFLIVCLSRHIKAHFSSSHHFGLEAAAWYWHFVDIIWLFLYVSIYWWGS